MGCKLFFISDGEINGSFKRMLLEYANSSTPESSKYPVNIPKRRGNAPKARSVVRAAVGAPPEKKIYVRGEYIRVD